MAEMTAIVGALDFLKSNLQPNQTAIIWTDSLSSIETLDAPIISQTLALEAHNLITKIMEQNQIKIGWVPGHKNHTGNEYADYLAKQGREKTQHVSASSRQSKQGKIKPRKRSTSAHMRKSNEG